MRYLLIALLAAACGDPDPGTPDGARDPDAPPSDAAIDAGPCTGRELTGEFVDWDSSTANFRGIANAQFRVEGAGGATASTAPNGRFIVCAPATGAVQLAIDAPGTYLDGTMYVDEAAVSQTVRTISMRSFTAARAPTFYTERALVYDATKAHVLVFLTGDRTPQTLNRAHGPEQGAEDVGDGALSWGMDGGRYILFPNVAADQPTATLEGAPNGPHTFTISPGKLTLVVLHFTFI